MSSNVLCPGGVIIKMQDTVQMNAACEGMHRTGVREDAWLLSSDLPLFVYI